MTGRLAVDFGTSNTVLAAWDAIRQEALLLHIPEYSQVTLQEKQEISTIPSLIHYTSDKRRWIGSQVFRQGLYNSPRTFRWMKRYISHRSPIKLRLEGQEITPFQAGSDFLNSILLFAAQEINLAPDEEVAFSVPVEAYEHYENWLAEVAESAGMPRYRLIDEPSAAALGYGAHIQPGSVYLIFDFGGGTLHAAVVLMENDPAGRSGQHCRVLGKAGRDVGGSLIDQWLFEEVLRQHHCTDSDEDVRKISNTLLVECERVKEQLSFREQADLSVINLDTGSTLSAAFTRAEFETILEQRGLYTHIDQTIRSAINSARERGYNEENIRSVFMVGGSSQIPSVQSTLKRIFGSELVHFGHPLDAIARGAAAYVAGAEFYDHIQHDYSVRYINPQTGTYDYRVIVQRGTPYPTQDSIARLSIKASYEGQQQLGLAIFEMGQQRSSPALAGSFELVFDPGGAARLMPITPQEEENRTLFWMNEQSPTFLIADPPAHRSEARFEIEFRIDANKRLTLTARDIQTGILTHKDYPVVKLT